jgi:hypothetical protein
VATGKECEEEAVDGVGLADDDFGYLGTEVGVALYEEVELFFV